MALVLKDRVKETSSSSGTGSITLTGAFAGYQTFNAAIASGSTVYYTIHNLVPGSDTEWEVGVGTFTSPATLSRDTVLSSSAGAPTKTNFTSGTEGLEVFVTQPAEEAVYLNQATGLVEVGGNGTNTVAFTNINASNVVMVSGTISTNAANATDITNKTYVDGLFSTGISYHAPVLVETPSALVAVYNQPNGAGNGVGATLTNNGANVALSIDGVSLSNTARVLVYNQSNAVQNGIYTVTNPGAPDPGGAKWVLTRATDADTYGLADPNKLGQGDAVFVQSGNTGAGKTYICNTPGTITFGSTNITFAQISSAQIYAAGTGLNLANLTFSIANTAVTAATYDGAGNTVSLTVNQQGQLTNVASVPINASSISVGTLDNARTTASASNGANTIVSRDTNGSFAANVVTATTVNATTGNFTNITANGAALTDINASNITSGTISNARTTGNTSNSASTLVLRDSNGSFGANVVSAASFSGDGTAITAINASNISSGTIANARTTAASANGASTIVQRDSGGNFSANTITANVSGSGSGLTNINASNITSGTIGNSFTTANSSNGAATIVLRGASGEFSAGAITGSSLAGNGASITALNATAITTGTIDNARTTASASNGANTIVLRDASGDFSVDGIIANWFTGNGANISAINASNISSGTIANARTTASSANGASTIVLRDASGDFAADAITANFFIGDGSNVSAINGSNVTTGTVANARTTASSANGANTIVLRDASGDFSVDGITANWLTGDGANLSAINASNVSSGTLSAARGGTGSANLTADNVILGNGASAVKVVAPGTANNVLTSNGTTWISQAPGGGFAAGTVMLFAQTSAPTGWTKNTTTGDNSALRVTTGAAGTGGSVGFTSAFVSQAVNGSIANTTAGGSVTITAVTGTAGDTTLTTPQIPSHFHEGKLGNAPAGHPGGGAPNISGPARDMGNTGGGLAHSHPFSFSSGSGSFTGTAHNHTFTGTAINLAVQYIDVIRATKD